MKTKLFLILFAMLSNVNICLADGGNGLPIIIEPKTNNEHPHRSPVYGVFNTITQTFTLTMNGEDTVEEVNIYKDGELIVSDQNPVAMSYALSVYGNGVYQVEVVTESGAIYIGTFTY